MGTESHLCASQVIESACSMPARCSLSAGERIAAPPHAASAWNHKLSSRQNWAISGSGSMTPAAVVPAVPTTRNGAQPSSRSWRTWRRRLIHVELQPAVGLDGANRTAPDPGHVRDLVEPVMRLAREIERRRR